MRHRKGGYIQSGRRRLTQQPIPSPHPQLDNMGSEEKLTWDALELPERNCNRLIKLNDVAKKKAVERAREDAKKDAEAKEGEIGRGAKRRAANVSTGNESHASSYFRTRRASPVIRAIILVPHPNPYCDLLRSSQRVQPTITASSRSSNGTRPPLPSTEPSLGTRTTSTDSKFPRTIGTS